MATAFKIHPAIGVARLGTASQENFYVAPEQSGVLPTEYYQDGKPLPVPQEPRFRDAGGKMLKQAARFKVFAYNGASDPGTEIKAGSQVGSKTVQSIEWTVYIASKKAAWYQFEQLLGSGLRGDKGYQFNNQNYLNPTYQVKEKDCTDIDVKYPSPLRQNSTFFPLEGGCRTEKNADGRLILDPGPRTVTAASFAPGTPLKFVNFDLNPSDPNLTPENRAVISAVTSKIVPNPIKTLGSLSSDHNGNLLVLAGDGNAGTSNINADKKNSPYQYYLTSYPNNDGWFDDISDGPVNGVIHYTDGTSEPVQTGAWVICGPPKYAPEIVNQVNLYDTLYDVNARAFGYGGLYNPATKTWNKNFKIDVASNITPILERPDLYQWVTNMPGEGVSGHTEAHKDGIPPGDLADYEEVVKQIVRDPTVENAENLGPLLMPQLAGHNPIYRQRLEQFKDGSGNQIPVPTAKYLVLSQTQFFYLNQWVAGQVGGTPPKQNPGELLDRGILENCVGGAFNPGIEITWITLHSTLYQNPGGVIGDTGVPVGLFRMNQKALAATSGKLTWDNGAEIDAPNQYPKGLEPGDLTKYMAQPWQADFNECSNQSIRTDPTSNNTLQSPTKNRYGQPLPFDSKADVIVYWWWPAQRPFEVQTENPGNAIDPNTKVTYPKNVPIPWTRGFQPETKYDGPQPNPNNMPNTDDMQMVTSWKDLGFLRSQTQEIEGNTVTSYLEVERMDAAILDFAKKGFPPA